MVPSPMQVVVVLAMVGSLTFAWAYAGRGRWRATAEQRLLYGVPWGTALTVAIVLGFYLFVQGGLRNWTDPVVYPFVSWSYYYPFGVLTSGIAHGSAPHIVSNLTATLVLGSIAEYAWGHYPGGTKADAESGTSGEGERTDGDGEEDWREAEWADDELLPDGAGTRRGVLERPLVRALVVFPGALLLAALLTAAFSLGPSIGFSGAVFAMAGFAIVRYPIKTLLSLAGVTALGTIYDAVNEPVVRGSLESGPPSLPSWAGVGFQAHALGFLLGVIAALAVVGLRDERPRADRLFLGVVAFGLAFSLWLVVWPSGPNTYYLYRGAGVVAVVVLSTIVMIAGTAEDYPLPRPFAGFDLVPSRRTLAFAWLALLAFFLGLAVLSSITVGAVVLAMVVPFVAILALPAVPVLLPDRFGVSPVGLRHLAIGAVIAVTILVAVPGPITSLAVVTDGQAPGDDTVSVGDYSLGYEENATIARELTFQEDVDQDNGTEYSGLFVVNQERELFTMGVRQEVLAYSGNETVVVGGPTWRETVEVERVGWEVAGNDTVYGVDIVHDGDRTRSFTSTGSTAESRVDGHEVAVVPDGETFQLEVSDAGQIVDTVSIPEVGSSAEVGEVTLLTEERDDARHIYVTTEDTRALVATEETY